MDNKGSLALSLIIVAIVLVIGIGIGVFYFLEVLSYEKPAPIPDNPNGEKVREYSEITYDDCVEEKLRELRTLPSANEEEEGAERLDGEGNKWIKQEDGWWKTDASKYGSTRWGAALIDEQPGGINYLPEEFPECKKYIFTRNAKMEEDFKEIMKQVVQEQAEKGITISFENIEVLNLAGRLQGSIDLVCGELDLETEGNIIESIADELFLKYPNEFTEDSERDSWVDVSGCSETGGSSDGVNFYYSKTVWRISDGYFDFLI